METADTRKNFISLIRDNLCARHPEFRDTEYYRTINEFLDRIEGNPEFMDRVYDAFDKVINNRKHYYNALNYQFPDDVSSTAAVLEANGFPHTPAVARTLLKYATMEFNQEHQVAVHEDGNRFLFRSDYGEWRKREDSVFHFVESALVSAERNLSLNNIDDREALTAFVNEINSNDRGAYIRQYIPFENIEKKLGINNPEQGNDDSRHDEPHPASSAEQDASVHVSKLIKLDDDGIKAYLKKNLHHAGRLSDEELSLIITYGRDLSDDSIYLDEENNRLFRAWNGDAALFEKTFNKKLIHEETAEGFFRLAGTEAQEAGRNNPENPEYMKDYVLLNDMYDRMTYSRDFRILDGPELVSFINENLSDIPENIRKIDATAIAGLQDGRKIYIDRINNDWIYAVEDGSHERSSSPWFHDRDFTKRTDVFGLIDYASSRVATLVSEHGRADLADLAGKLPEYADTIRSAELARRLAEGWKQHSSSVRLTGGYNEFLLDFTDWPLLRIPDSDDYFKLPAENSDSFSVKFSTSGKVLSADLDFFDKDGGLLVEDAQDMIPERSQKIFYKALDMLVPYLAREYPDEFPDYHPDVSVSDSISLEQHEKESGIMLNWDKFTEEQFEELKSMLLLPPGDRPELDPAFGHVRAGSIETQINFFDDDAGTEGRDETIEYYIDVAGEGELQCWQLNNIPFSRFEGSFDASLIIDNNYEGFRQIFGEILKSDLADDPHLLKEASRPLIDWSDRQAVEKLYAEKCLDPVLVPEPEKADPLALLSAGSKTDVKTVRAAFRAELKERLKTETDIGKAASRVINAWNIECPERIPVITGLLREKGGETRADMEKYLKKLVTTSSHRKSSRSDDDSRSR